MPDPGNRFMSMQVISEDHYVPDVFYGAGSHTLTRDAFWSVSIYNAQGYFQKNPANAYVVNSVTAKKNSDGAVPIQFGGCNGKADNCLPIVPGWNYTVRLYRPRAEILSGNWKFPEPQPVQ